MKRLNHYARTTTVRFGIPLLVFMVISAAISAAVWAAPAAQEDEESGHRGFLAANGRVTFRVYCANCHGADAKGGGSIAHYLKIPPADLTRLTEMNDGVFPAEKVQKVMDGREEVRGHGVREMPIWGDVFQSPLSEHTTLSDETGEERSQRKIREVVLYLESIQVVEETTEAASDG